MSHGNGLSALEYRKLADLIHSECGIAFSESKRVMMETRLGRRARALGMESLKVYCQYLYTPEGRAQEGPYLIDEVTTHKTDFFREPAHFDYLLGHIVPELAAGGIGIRRPLRIWSAASSTGEEPYTLAMLMAEHSRSLPHGTYQYQIEATDISRGTLEKAQRAVYTQAVVAPVPEALQQRYMLRSKDPESRLVRMRPEIRSQVQFRQLNLLDRDYGFTEPQDVVFCRNVMIYFDRPMQQRILSKIVETLAPGRYLLMGHSESLNGLDLRVEQVVPTVYRRCR